MRWLDRRRERRVQQRIADQHTFAFVSIWISRMRVIQREPRHAKRKDGYSE